MKINNTFFDKNEYNNKIGQKIKNSKPNKVKCDYDKESHALNLYIPFCGISKTIDARIITEDLQMQPQQEYLVDRKTGFYLSNSYINLSDPDIKPYIDNMQNNGSIIIGKQGIRTENMNDEVSRQHLKIRKDNYGRLIAQDLNSTNGTKIAKNVVVLDKLPQVPYKIQSGVKYLIAKNATLGLDNMPLALVDLKDRLKDMKDGDFLIAGRSKKADIQISDNHVSREHLKIQKYKNKIIIEDLNSTNGTFITGCTPATYKNDFSNITHSVYLQKGQPTLLPDDAQIHIADGVTLDLRNKNILKLLDERGSIIIGRSDNCDIKMDNFHEKLSREHLRLTRTRDGIVGTDLYSSNGTQLIPKNEIKPFYESMQNLNLSQSNIGDCFLLSAIYAIAHHPSGEKILNNMVKVDDNGNYIVTFHNSSPISVAPEELDGQINPNGKIKVSVSGELGLKAIERAYGKKIKYGLVSRFANFLDHNSERTLFLGIDQGGTCSNAMKILTGSSIRTLSSKGDLKWAFEEIDKNGGQNTYIINCSTPNKGKGDYMDADKRFIKNHMYIVGGYDIQHKRIDIINPHDTRYVYPITFDEFSQYFDNLYWANPNS